MRRKFVATFSIKCHIYNIHSWIVTLDIFLCRTINSFGERSNTWPPSMARKYSSICSFVHDLPVLCTIFSYFYSFYQYAYMIFPDVCFVQAISFKDDGRSENMRELAVNEKRSFYGNNFTYKFAKKGEGLFAPLPPSSIGPVSDSPRTSSTTASRTGKSSSLTSEPTHSS